MILLVFLILLIVPSLVDAQVTCSRYGDSVYCDGARGPVSITEFSPGMGIIQTEKTTEPYAIIGGRERSTSFDPTPLPTLDTFEPLPSLGIRSYDAEPSTSLWDTGTFEEREAVRRSGRIPW